MSGPASSHTIVSPARATSGRTSVGISASQSPDDRRSDLYNQSLRIGMESIFFGGFSPPTVLRSKRGTHTKSTDELSASPPSGLPITGSLSPSTSHRGLTFSASARANKLSVPMILWPCQYEPIDLVLIPDWREISAWFHPNSVARARNLSAKELIPNGG